MNFVIAELGLKAIVKNIRIEEVTIQPVKYIVSRAVAQIPQIIQMAKQVINKDTICMFHVGKNDIIKAVNILRDNFIFELQEEQNPYRANCSIISIRNLRYLNV